MGESNCLFSLNCLLLFQKIQFLLCRIAEEVDLAEDVDVRDLQVDHDTERGSRGRQELGAVHHEVRVDLQKGISWLIN